MSAPRLRLRVAQHVPQEILDAGDWKAEQLGIPRKEVFRQFRTPDLLAEYRAATAEAA